MANYATILSIVAIVIAAASFAVSAHVAFRDRARLKISAKLIPESEYGNRRIVVTMVNRGRRPVILRMLGMTDAQGKWTAEFIDYKEGGRRLGEHERYEQVLVKEDTVSFHPEHDAFFGKTLWVEDSLGMRHRIPKSQELIKALWA